VFSSVPESSSWLPGILDAEVDDAWDGSWKGSFEVLLYLMAKPFHMSSGEISFARSNRRVEM
jgi:hypothetical protein